MSPTPTFWALSLKTPAKTVPPTPGTALQQKIESKLEKSLCTQFNFQLLQEMGAFQASMLEAMKSLRDEMQSMKKTERLKKWNWIRAPLLLQSLAPVNSLIICPRTLLRTHMVLCLHDSEMLSLNMAHQSDLSEQPEQVCSARAKKHSDKYKHMVRTKYLSQSSSLGGSVHCSQEKVYSAP